MTTPLDIIYTADEAAERLRLTNRGVIRLAKKHGLCSRLGRDYRFSESDLLGLWEAMREPATDPPRPTVKVTSIRDSMKNGFWLFGPRVAVDLREIGVLRLLSEQKAPRTHKEIDRAGPRTIETFLRRGFVVEKGRDDEGNPRVVITSEGRDQISIVDRWIKLRVQNGRSPGSWARHLKQKP